MVGDKAIFLILVLPITCKSVFTLAASSSLGWFNLPRARCTIGALASVLYSVFPVWKLATAFGRSSEIVPFLGLGIKPLGPKTLATLVSLAIHAGVVIKI